MHKIIISVSVILILSPTHLHSQPAQVLFVNSNNAATASSLDLEISIMPQDSLIGTFTNISYLGATTPISVPSLTQLKFTYLKSGTTTVFASYDSEFYFPGVFTIQLLSGDSSFLIYSGTTASLQSSGSNLIKYHFIQSEGIGMDIDLVIRETGLVLADNFSAFESTLPGTPEFNASDVTLDITPYNDPNGLYAYALQGSSLGGEYIYLFTEAVDTAFCLLMVQVNGTVTKLASLPPITVGINEPEIKAETAFLYPNPTNDLLIIETNSSNKFSYAIYNIQGGEILKSEESSDKMAAIDVRELPSGVYGINILIEGRGGFRKFLKL